MSVVIRKAVKEDCAKLLELVYELAVYEKAPQQVTVTLDHFIESGFGKNPVWYGFVATSSPVLKNAAFIGKKEKRKKRMGLHAHGEGKKKPDRKKITGDARKTMHAFLIFFNKSHRSGERRGKNTRENFRGSGHHRQKKMIHPGGVART